MYVLRLRFRQNGYGFDAAVEGLQLFLPPEKQWSKSKINSFSMSPFFPCQTPKRRELKVGETFSAIDDVRPFFFQGFFAKILLRLLKIS